MTQWTQHFTDNAQAAKILTIIATQYATVNSEELQKMTGLSEATLYYYANTLRKQGVNIPRRASKKISYVKNAIELMKVSNPELFKV